LVVRTQISGRCESLHFFLDTPKKNYSHNSIAERKEIFISVMIQLFKQLCEMHEKGVVHGNLNFSSNVFIQYIGSSPYNVKIVDFSQGFVYDQNSFSCEKRFVPPNVIENFATQWAPEKIWALLLQHLQTNNIEPNIASALRSRCLGQGPASDIYDVAYQLFSLHFTWDQYIPKAVAVKTAYYIRAEKTKFDQLFHRLTEANKIASFHNRQSMLEGIWYFWETTYDADKQDVAKIKAKVQTPKHADCLELTDVREMSTHKSEAKENLFRALMILLHPDPAKRSVRAFFESAYFKDSHTNKELANLIHTLPRIIIKEQQEEKESALGDFERLIEPLFDKLHPNKSFGIGADALKLQSIKRKFQEPGFKQLESGVFFTSDTAYFRDKVKEQFDVPNLGAVVLKYPFGEQNGVVIPPKFTNHTMLLAESTYRWGGDAKDEIKEVLAHMLEKSQHEHTIVQRAKNKENTALIVSQLVNDRDDLKLPSDAYNVPYDNKHSTNVSKLKFLDAVHTNQLVQFEKTWFVTYLHDVNTTVSKYRKTGNDELAETLLQSQVQILKKSRKVEQVFELLTGSLLSLRIKLKHMALVAFWYVALTEKDSPGLIEALPVWVADQVLGIVASARSRS